MILYLLTLAIGILISIMVGFNGELGIRIGNLEGVVFVNVLGLVVTLITLIFLRKTWKPFRNIAPIYFMGGMVGTFLLVMNNVCFKALGASLTIAMGIIGQIIMSSLIDNYGLFEMKKYPFRKKKLIGIAFMLLGIYIMVKI